MTNEQMKDIAKIENICRYLDSLGYRPMTELDAIHIIQRYSIDVSSCPLPYNSQTIDEWKNIAGNRDKTVKDLQSQISDKNTIRIEDHW